MATALLAAAATQQQHHAQQHPAPPPPQQQQQEEGFCCKVVRTEAGEDLVVRFAWDAARRAFDVDVVDSRLRVWSAEGAPPPPPPPRLLRPLFAALLRRWLSVGGPSSSGSAPQPGGLHRGAACCCMSPLPPLPAIHQPVRTPPLVPLSLPVPVLWPHHTAQAAASRRR